MNFILFKQYIFISFVLFNKCSTQTTRLRPKIENSVSSLLNLFKNPKAEDQAAIFSAISVLSKTLRKLEGWIKTPRHPERPQERYLNDGLQMVKESAKFTKLDIDDDALKTLFGWTEEEFLDWMELKEKTENLRVKLFETVKLRLKKPAKPKMPDGNFEEGYKIVRQELDK